MANKKQKTQVEREVKRKLDTSTEEQDGQEVRVNRQIFPDEYCFKFGKYKDQKATQVIKEEKKVKDKKTGEYKFVKTGLSYIQWLVQTDWLNQFDKDMLNEIIRENE